MLLSSPQIYYVYFGRPAGRLPCVTPLDFGWMFPHFRSLLADPVFTYRYGYSFAILILSFLLSEFTGDQWNSIIQNNSFYWT